MTAIWLLLSLSVGAMFGFLLAGTFQLAKISDLQEEVAEWKSRWEAERADHQATIDHADKMMNERYAETSRMMNEAMR